MIVVALKRERRAVMAALDNTTSSSTVLLSGIGAPNAAKIAQQVHTCGHGALACIGLAGGLSPQLRCGDIVIANEVVDDSGERIALDATWRAAATKRLGSARSWCEGPLLSANTIVSAEASKYCLFQRTGAIAVDMETAALARAAGAYRLRMLALRVVGDEQAVSLPPVLPQLVDRFGSLRPGRAFSQLARRPGLMTELWRLARVIREAERSLTEAVHCLGPNLALPEQRIDSSTMRT